MIAGIAVLALFVAFAVGIAWLLWRDVDKYQRRDVHIHVFDAGIVENGHDVLMFCRCGESRLIVRGRVIR